MRSSRRHTARQAALNPLKNNNKLTISEKDSYISKDAAIDLYEAGIKATSNGEASGLNSEFYSRDYFAVAQDEPDYLMLSFDTFEAKAAFCERFGYDPYAKFIKGEIFDEQVERIE